VLLLYALVVPPFTSVRAFTAREGQRSTSLAAVLGLCGAAMLATAWARTPAGAALGPRGRRRPHALLRHRLPREGDDLAGLHRGDRRAPGLVGSSLRRGLHRRRLLTGLACCFWLGAAGGRVAHGVANAVVFGVIQALVGWVVPGKTLRHRRARLRSLSRHLNDLELVIRADTGWIVEANDRALVAYGFTREELVGRSIRELRLPDEAALIGEQLHAASSSGVRFQAEQSARTCSSPPTSSTSGRRRWGERGRSSTSSTAPGDRSARYLRWRRGSCRPILRPAP